VLRGAAYTAAVQKIESPCEAVPELDIPPGRLGALGVAENTPSTHNVVVCTLCSCYPYSLLGDVPWWYKHDSYRERVVRGPRGTLAEMFDFMVPPDLEVRVWDSTRPRALETERPGSCHVVAGAGWVERGGGASNCLTPALLLRGVYRLRDSSLGIVSRPAGALVAHAQSGGVVASPSLPYFACDMRCSRARFAACSVLSKYARPYFKSGSR
jgi:hypothetical protein